MSQTLELKKVTLHAEAVVQGTDIKKIYVYKAVFADGKTSDLVASPITLVKRGEISRALFAPDDLVTVIDGSSMTPLIGSNMGREWNADKRAMVGTSHRIIRIDDDGDIRIGSLYFSPSFLVKGGAAVAPLKCGDSVVNDKVWSTENGVGWNTEMTKLCGRVGTVDRVRGDSVYVKFRESETEWCYLKHWVRIAKPDEIAALQMLDSALDVFARTDASSEALAALIAARLNKRKRAE